jgi:hypothetical protein
VGWGEGQLISATVRVLSLIPEATEILAAIGYGGQVRTVQGADGLRRALDEARPDLIFTSETAAGGGVPRREVRRIVAGYRPRPAVYALEPHSFGDILSDVKTVGDAVGCQVRARALIEALRARIDAVSLRAAQAAALTGPRWVACLVAADPPVAAGWWQAELVGLAGGQDVLDGVGRPSRPTTWAEIERAAPDLVVVLGAPALHTLPWGGGDTGAPSTSIPSVPTAPPAPLPRKQEKGETTLLPSPVATGEGLGAGAVPGVTAGPGAIDLLEQLAALLLQPGTACTV